MELTGKIALITGASAGIGLETAKLLSACGATVVLVARGLERLLVAEKEIQDTGGRTTLVQADVSKDAECVDLIEQVANIYGRLDILVNNAGLHHRGDYVDKTPEDLAEMINTNLRSPIFLTRLALPMLIESQGHIVNVASIAGMTPLPGAAVYSASKFGLRAFSLALRQELRQHGVNVSLVSPGPVDTGFIMNNLEDLSDLTLSQPVSTADEVARTVLRAIEYGKPEVAIPGKSGFLAKFAYNFPFVGQMIKPFLSRKGARVRRQLLLQRQRAQAKQEAAPRKSSD